jgi:hypothetical protein
VLSARKSSQNGWGLVAAAVVAVALAAPVGAHEAEAGLLPRLLAVEPHVEGLDVEVGQVVAPTVTVRNATGSVVDVIGGDGTAFLRIGAEFVQANVASPDFFRSEGPSPAAAVPASAAAGAPPRFVTISSGGEWSWFEHRLSAAGRGPWTVPLSVGGVEVAVRGDWRRADVTGSFTVVVDALEPSVDGLAVEALQGAVPGLFVENRTGRALEVPGPRGEPFLRIGPNVTERADGAGGWERVAASPRYGWTEPRIGWPAGEPLPRELRGADRARTARTWTLDLVLGDRPVAASGTLRWVPVAAHHDDGFPLVRVVGGLGAVGVIAAVALAEREYRRRRPARSP